MPQYVPLFDSPPSITNRLVSNSRELQGPRTIPRVSSFYQLKTIEFGSGAAAGEGGGRNRTPGVAVGLSLLSPCFLTVHTVLIGDHERCAFRQPIWWLRALRTKFFRWIDLKSVISSPEFALKITFRRQICIEKTSRRKKLKNVPYFLNQIGKRVVFTEDGDNPYYKQASPGITDYFPSVQDKQTKTFLF